MPHTIKNIATVTMRQYRKNFKFISSLTSVSDISVKSITDYVTSTGRKVSQNTIDDYVEALVEPYIFYPVERYDVLGKQLLKKNQKISKVRDYAEGEFTRPSRYKAKSLPSTGAVISNEDVIKKNNITFEGFELN